MSENVGNNGPTGNVGGADPVPAPPPAPAPPTIPPSSSHLSDAELRQAAATIDGYRGSMIAMKSHYEERIGALNQQLELLNEGLTGRSQRLSEAETQLQALGEQVQSIPGLQEQAQRAQQLEVLNQRLDVVLRYPNIVGQTEIVTVGEGDEAKQERRNPVLDLLLSSSLDGDAWLGMVEQMSGKLVPGVAQPPANRIVGSPPPSPVPGEGTPEQQLADLRKQADEASLSGNYSMAQALQDQIAEIRSKSGK